MRWDRLFADLDGQADAWALAERDAEVADRTRAENAQLALADRLRAHRGQAVRLMVAGAGEVAGRLDALGDGWLLVAGARDQVVVTSAVLAVHNLAPLSVGEWAQDVVDRRLRLTSVMRAVARDRSAVEVHLVDGAPWVGTPDRVGADWVELALHDRGEAPRRDRVRGRLTVSFAAIAVVTRLPPLSG